MENTDSEPRLESLEENENNNPKIELDIENIESDMPIEVIEINTWETVTDQVKKLSNFVESIKKDFELRNERDRYKDEGIHRMSVQISDFEQGIFEKIKIGLISEIISFYDSLLNFQLKFKDVDIQGLENETDFLVTEISNLLFNNGIVEMEQVSGLLLNRDLHLVKNKVFTEIIGEDLLITDILKKGFIWNDKIIRKQEVIIKEYKEKG